MQCDRAEPGLRAPSVDVENKAAALSPWVRTTLPVCQELPTLPVLAEKAAWVEFQVRARLITRPTGTATGSTVRRARGARWCTASPPTRWDATVCVLDTSGIGAPAGPLRSRADPLPRSGGGHRPRPDLAGGRRTAARPADRVAAGPRG